MATTTWNLDASHSDVGFKVRHLMITNVKGRFEKFTATAITEDDQFETAKIKFEVDVNSINTGNEQRDGHLKAADFFDTEHHPSITFESVGMTKVKENEYKVMGNLTVKGITKSIEVSAIVSELVKDPWGQTKVGFEVTTKIDRADYGLVWNAPLETGGLLLSDDVYLHADVQFIKAQ